jgi:hypothetical protein
MQLVRNKKTNEIGKLIQRQQKYFTVLVEWSDRVRYHRDEEIEVIPDNKKE